MPGLCLSRPSHHGQSATKAEIYLDSDKHDWAPTREMTTFEWIFPSRRSPRKGMMVS